MSLIFPLLLFVFQTNLISVTSTSIVNQPSQKQRKIVVCRDVRPQKMFCYEGDSLVKEFLVSTGRKDYQTALGKYQILTKRSQVWSRKWECWMLWWQSITEPTPLRNGIHALESKNYEEFLG